MERHSKSRSSTAHPDSDAVGAELADDEVRLPPVVTERRKPREPHRDVYTIVTERIEAALEAGTIPWKKTWAVEGGMPRNLASGKQYRGLNVLLLSLGQPYRSPWWLTFRQAEDLGGHIRKDEHSSIVTFWKFPNKQTDTDERPVKNKGEIDSDHHAPLLRYYNVFNLEQCEGIEAPPSAEFQPKQHERIELCEAIVQRMPQPPEIRRDPRQAVYAPRPDIVYIPDLDQFETAEQYYATLFHELIHSSGHQSRLARPALGTPTPFGTPDYSKEELVAEFGSAFLCEHAGIFPSTVENQASYINGWLAVLKKDKRVLPIAAAQAQRAADFILGEPPRAYDESQTLNKSVPIL